MNLTEAINLYYFHWCFKECEDDVGWNNGDGIFCSDYEQEKLCDNGYPSIIGKDLIGSLYNNPELHCCACGKLGRGKLFLRHL